MTHAHTIDIRVQYYKHTSINYYHEQYMHEIAKICTEIKINRQFSDRCDITELGNRLYKYKGQQSAFNNEISMGRVSKNLRSSHCRSRRSSSFGSRRMLNWRGRFRRSSSSGSRRSLRIQNDRSRRNSSYEGWRSLIQGCRSRQS